jgi:hypothetical protein
MSVHRARVDAEVDSFDTFPMLPIEVHVEVSDLQLGELPLECRGFDAEVAEGADGHIAADAGGTVEEQNAHGKEGAKWPWNGEPSVH